MRSFFDIAPYAVAEHDDGYAVFKGVFRLTDAFDCEGDAYGHAHAFLDEDEEAAEADAAEQAEIEAEEARRVEAELRADAAAILAEIGEAA
ncbi:hypothetical protein ABC766_00135 [Methylobacterium fujisawaense]|uniref:hypothetical protein n=1 Tax=Methylobacterium fujisawaense TaxID=107400 RepID=UPI0031F5D519